MPADEDLLAELAELTRWGGPLYGRRARIHEWVDEYCVACLLSRGPDAGRAAHWGARARLLARRLESLVDGRRPAECGVRR